MKFRALFVLRVSFKTGLKAGVLPIFVPQHMTMLQIPDNEFDGLFIVVGERPATFTKRSDFSKVRKAVIVFKKTFRLSMYLLFDCVAGLKPFQ